VDVPHHALGKQPWLLRHQVEHPSRKARKGLPGRPAPLSPRAYARALAVSVDTALLDLRELVGRGLVRAEGTTRDRRYVLAGDDRS
jgi:hypothetical protein